MEIKVREATSTQLYAKAGNRTATTEACCVKSDGNRDPKPPFLRLPDDLLVEICSYFSITEYFSLRQTNHRIAAFLKEYVSTIGPYIARNTPFTPSWTLPPVDTTPWTVHRLHTLIPLNMATILASEYRHISRELYFGSSHGFAPNDPLGRSAITHIANGIRVWAHLSAISQRLSHSPPQLPKLLSSYRTKLIESRVLAARVRALRKPYSKTGHSTYKAMVNLEQQDKARACAIALYLTHFSVTGCWRETSTAYHPLHRCKEERGYFLPGSWVNWAMLHEGPGMFWGQWSGRSPGNVTRRLVGLYVGRNEAQRDVESAYAGKWMNMMRGIAMGENEDSIFWDRGWCGEEGARVLLERKGGVSDGVERVGTESGVGMAFFVFLCCNYGNGVDDEPEVENS